jgi:uncharacterized protein (TIGR03382 family)
MRTEWRIGVLATATAALVVSSGALAQDDPQVLVLDCEVPEEGDFFELPFVVPDDVVEIEVRHETLPTSAPDQLTNILDWGVIGPDGFRGYGGGNTEPARIGEEAASRSYIPGPITPGTWRVYVGKARIDEPPGACNVEVELRFTAELDPQPERAPYAPAAPLSHDARWYAGDFHVHSRESGDAFPTLDEVADFALGRGLDFVMLSEHNTVSQLELYADAQARHPMLLFVPGIEITTYQGHANAIGVTEWIDHRLGFEGVTAQQTADDTHAQGGLFSISHPVLALGNACIGCAWTATLDGDSVDAVEIQTGAYSVTGSLFFDNAIAFWEDLLAQGHRVAALGGSDDHSAGASSSPIQSPTGSPTTMVWAEELSVDAIMEGIRQGRTVVKLQGPEDPMLELDAEGRDGDTVAAAETTLQIRVTDVPAGGASLRLVRNGQAGPPVEVLGDPFVHEEQVLAPASGRDWIRAELWVTGAPRVVTSHLFLRASSGDAGAEPGELDGDGGGCGCDAAGLGGAPPGAAGMLVLLLLLLRARRARRHHSA